MKAKGNPILLVDDNPGDIYLMIEAAKAIGVPLVGCSTATDAIARLDNGDKPLLILFDLNLPGVSGFDLLRILKSKPEWRHIVAVVFSSAMSPAEIQKAYAMHANAVVKKPSDFEGLQELIRHLNDFWLKWVVHHEHK
jgi:CheY-like chemotaxis protein